MSSLHVPARTQAACKFSRMIVPGTVQSWAPRKIHYIFIYLYRYMHLQVTEQYNRYTLARHIGQGDLQNEVLAILFYCSSGTLFLCGKLYRYLASRSSLRFRVSDLQK